MRTLYLGVLEHTPQISRELCNLVCFGPHFRDISLKKIYINILLRTSYRYGVFLEYYFKLQFSAS